MKKKRSVESYDLHIESEVQNMLEDIYKMLGFDDTVFDTHGADGWPEANSFGKTFGKSSFIGKLVNFAGGNISLTHEPIWQPKDGSNQ